MSVVDLESIGIPTFSVANINLQYVKLAGGWATPLKHMKVSWDDYSQYMESHKIHVPNHQPAKLIFFIKSRCKSMRRCVLCQNLGLWHLVPFHATSHRFLVFRSATASRDSQQSKHVKRMFQGIWDYSYNTFGLKNKPRMCKSKNRDATETYGFVWK